MIISEYSQNYNVEGQLEKINMYVFRVLKICETLGIYTCIVYSHSNRVSAISE